MTSRNMLEFTLGGPQIAVHALRIYPKNTVKCEKQTHEEKADMSCLVYDIQPLSSPVSFQITSCIRHSDRRHADITASLSYRQLCAASLLAPPSRSDLREEKSKLASA